MKTGLKKIVAAAALLLAGAGGLHCPDARQGPGGRAPERSGPCMAARHARSELQSLTKS